MQLHLDPVRVRALRERIGMPLSSAASRSGLSEARIEELELHGGVVEVDVARRLAKAYNRNWYVFLLDNGPGRPSLPRDFRRLGRDRPLSAETLIAFDDAEALIEKILDLPRDDEPAASGLLSIAVATPTKRPQLCGDDLQSLPMGNAPRLVSTPRFASGPSICRELGFM